MSALGSEAFLNILPVYMDHVLFPTMTELAFQTEVHHIDGEGKDVGKMYQALEASEEKATAICYRE
jgi:Zn-dependent M16 (insulinase) family peptidase